MNPTTGGRTAVPQRFWSQVVCSYYTFLLSLFEAVLLYHTIPGMYATSSYFEAMMSAVFHWSYVLQGASPSGEFRQLRMLTRKMKWNNMTDVARRWSNVIGANRRLANVKSSMLQENKTSETCIYLVSVYIFWYVIWSARTWFAASCRGDYSVPCCALLCSRFWYSTTTYSYILLLYCCCCIPVQPRRKNPWKKLAMKA